MIVRLAGGDSAKDQPSTKSAACSGSADSGSHRRQGVHQQDQPGTRGDDPAPGNDGRFKQSVRREVLLERRKLAGAGVATLEVPNPLPEPGKNTWLMYDEPQGRFHLLHPQDLRPVRAYPEGGVDLLARSS